MQDPCRSADSCRYLSVNPARLLPIRAGGFNRSAHSAGPSRDSRSELGILSLVLHRSGIAQASQPSVGPDHFGADLVGDSRSPEYRSSIAQASLKHRNRAWVPTILGRI